MYLCLYLIRWAALPAHSFGLSNVKNGACALFELCLCTFTAKNSESTVVCIVICRLMKKKSISHTREKKPASEFSVRKMFYWNPVSVVLRHWLCVTTCMCLGTEAYAITVSCQAFIPILYHGCVLGAAVCEQVALNQQTMWSIRLQPNRGSLRCSRK